MTEARGHLEIKAMNPPHWRELNPMASIIGTCWIGLFLDLSTSLRPNRYQRVDEVGRQWGSQAHKVSSSSKGVLETDLTLP